MAKSREIWTDGANHATKPTKHRYVGFVVSLEGTLKKFSGWFRACVGQYRKPTPNEVNMKAKKQCGAHARSTALPCKAKALPNGRCKLHGGMSTGPKTREGKQAIGTATKARMAAGQLAKAQEGRRRWLAAGGREYLSRLAKRRAARLKWKKLMT